MISTAINSFKHVFHASCDAKKLESKVSNFESLVEQLTKENNELRAIYNYQMMELEQELSNLRISYDEQNSISSNLSAEVNRIHHATQGLGE